MGQETEDSQKLRRAAAAAYDYDNDPRWAVYLSNILIPPHLSSRSDVLDHFKRKFYQRYIDPNLVVEVMSTNGSSQSTMPSTSSSSLSPPSDVHPRTRNTGSTARASGPSATAGQNPTSVHWDRQTIQFSVNAWQVQNNLLEKQPIMNFPVLIIHQLQLSSDGIISLILDWPKDGTDSLAIGFDAPPCNLGYLSTLIALPIHYIYLIICICPCMQVFIVAVLAIIPLAPKNLSRRAYRLSFMGTACSSLYSLYTLNGRPRAWNLQGIQVYLQSIMATKDFIYFIYCITFVTSHLCLKFALISILCRSLEHVAKFLRRNFSRSTLYRKYFEDPCVWVESNTTTLSILSSHTEIGLGFLLIVSLFSWQRNIIQTFMYWQLLKLMYHAPVTAVYHQSVWSKIERTINPLVHRYCPFLNTPLSAVQRWWLR
ncbi:hypothetical protein SADUNF_Sadunf04G0080200 [Salix dunnii]|uniref:Uncharacterized protein n=1 Tax=Salix dunnii TaxID=1413687 RepID=A0A835K8S5_9ROSI|nr:hypothetical protein SADUNF_Sadunf04G0080200 [Salix dunnii]